MAITSIIALLVIFSTNTTAAVTTEINAHTPREMVIVLGGEEASVYNDLYEGVRNFDREVEISGDKETIIKMVKLLRENPEIFWFGSEQRISTDSNGDKYTVTVTYPMSEAEVQQLQRQIELVTAEIFVGKNISSKEEANEVVTDWLITNVRYDKDGLDTIPSNSTVVGPLLEGKAICGGYASATCSATSLKR